MRISAFAKAWQSLLGVYDRGQGVKEVSDVLAGVIELRDMYGLNYRKLYVDAVVPDIVAPGGTPLMTVPNGKVWRMMAFSLSFVVGAGENITDFHLLIIPADGGGGSVAITPPLTFGPIADGDLIWDPKGLMLNPGDRIGCTSGAVIGAIRVVPRALVEEFDV